MNRRNFLIGSTVALTLGMFGALSLSVASLDNKVYEVVYSKDKSEYGILIYEKGVKESTVDTIRRYVASEGHSKIISKKKFSEMRSGADHIEEITEESDGLVIVDVIKLNL